MLGIVSWQPLQDAPALALASSPENAVRSTDDVVPVRHSVDLKQIHTVSPEPLEALLDAASCTVIGAIAGFGCEEDLAATTGEDLAVIGLRLTVVIRRGCVEISYAQV